jgi:hypothetical protein
MIFYCFKHLVLPARLWGWVVGSSFLEPFENNHHPTLHMGILHVCYELPLHIHGKGVLLALLVENVGFHMPDIHHPEVSTFVFLDANVVEFPLAFFQNH